MTSGYLLPQAFITADRAGYIQDASNIPILYHYPRNQSNKFLNFNINLIDINKMKYLRYIPTHDKLDFRRLNFKKYWWLSNDAKFIDEI